MGKPTSFYPYRSVCSQALARYQPAQTLGARRVIGVDIDDTLIRAAWKRRRTVWSLQGPGAEPENLHELEDAATGEKRKRSGKDKDKANTVLPAIVNEYFPASCEHMFGPLPIPSSGSSPDTFPHNVVFRTADWVNTEIVEDVEGYDVVLAFSITKWIHLNEGDAGLRRFFERVYAVLNPGGVFVLEPQEWETYGKAKRMDTKLKENAKGLKLHPDDFERILTEVGFSAAEHLGKAGEGGFRRAIDLYRKK
ncbi:hypothetical protein EIP86_010124 [Pleurotus ostreatoroseus]|nr:hypothetical protein EIP86_010124 [Pleurotus ostreatoroseus]